MKGLFNELFDYNFYCNKKIIETCGDLKKVPKKSQELFSHILNTHHIWNKRLLNEDPVYGEWQSHKVKHWGDIHYENQRTTFGIMTNTDDFNKRIDYKTVEERVFGNVLKDILFQIINHSTYYRGQIFMDLKKHKVELGPIDYIFYKR